jgi:AhpD family alkylhydroperoxidase
MTTPPTSAVRLDFETHGAGIVRAISHLDNAATKELDRVGLDAPLRELVRIRASQLNGCAYCVDMHTKDARAIGETEQRIYALTVWPETPFFDERERAALAFTEKVTLLAQEPVSAEDFAAVSAVFIPEEVAALLGLIIAINAWNMVAASTHAWEPGSYQP